MIDLDLTNVLSFVSADEIANMQPQVNAAFDLLHSRRGPGSDFLGWMDLPVQYDREEFARIEAAAEKIRSDSQILVVIGIGGSYLGARAAIEMTGHTFASLLPEHSRGLIVVFAGTNLSAAYMADLVEAIGERDLSINVISKSGTTTEPAIAFRLFKRMMEERYGRAGARERIYVTTDGARGVLKQLADAEGYDSFVVPDDIGGRYSVLTPVGLLPIAAAGVDIAAMMDGAAKMRERLSQPDLSSNPACRYAAVRNCLLRRGYLIEVLVQYEPAMHSLTEWWKQLFGESEGKDGRGLFPAGVDNTMDLHSMGQYIQQGRRIIFETVLAVAETGRSVVVPEDLENRDGLNFLAGSDLQAINQKAMQGTALAHVDGGVPNLLIKVQDLSAAAFGALVYFFEMACAISGYLLAVNPFDQPGVESYKVNMFALLGKPGFKKRRAELEQRLASGAGDI